MRLTDHNDSFDDMPNPEAYKQLQDDLHSAVTEAYRKFAKNMGPDATDQYAMLTGYALVTEFGSFTGNRRLDMMFSEDSRLWQIKSWLDHALTDIQAQQLALHLARYTED